MEVKMRSIKAGMIIDVFGDIDMKTSDALSAVLRELADKKSYRQIIEKITSELEDEFLELKEEAENIIYTNNTKQEIDDIDYEELADDTNALDS